MIALLIFLLFFLFLLLIVGTIVLIVLISKVNRLSERLECLETIPSPPRKPISSPSAPAARPQAGEREMPPVVGPTPVPPPPKRQTSPLQRETPKKKEHPWLKEGWEWFIGGRLLNRIGALALILGFGFFLKYAFDRNWITESVRVWTGGALGIGLVLLGGRFRRKGMTVFAQGLVGAGLAIDYLAVYASFNFYHLIPQPAALFLMSLVTALAFQQSLRHDSIAVSLLGWAGGFLTPFLLSTGEVNEVGLLSYMALLTAGLLLVSLKKEKWVPLPPLTLIGTYFIWLSVREISENTLLLFGFLTLYWGMFLAAEVRFGRNRQVTGRVLRQAAAAVHALMYFGGMFLLFHQDQQLAGWISLGVGLVYWLIQWKLPLEKGFATQMKLTALTFAGVAVPLWFSPFPTVALWGLGALALLWQGRRKSSPHLRIFASILYMVAFLRLLSQGEAWMAPVETHLPLWNLRALAFLLLAGAAAGGALLLRRTRGEAWSIIQGALQTGWVMLLFLWMTVETNDWFRQRLAEQPGSETALNFTHLMGLAGIWSLYALSLVWVGLKKRMYPLLFSGTGILFLSLVVGGIRGLMYQPLDAYLPLFNLRFLVLGLSAAVLLGVSFQLRRHESKNAPWAKRTRVILPLLASLVLFELFTVETRDYFQQALERLPSGDAEASRSLFNMQQLAISGVWLLYSITLMAVGIRRRLRSLRILAMGLFGLTILKIFIFDLSFLDTLYRIFSFIGLGLILLAVSYIYQRYKDRFSLTG
ncbi:hypothetical protein HMPREF9374_1821 [Desmospora sp. 8437]|nr:hypothetical protein HMPREF9374_1821 [Desmospora sp. 8437]